MKGELGKFHVSEPLERLHVDILGPFCTSSKGNKYILMVVDQFTKWLECHPIPDQTAGTVCRTLVGEVICRLGLPRSIHTDQGRNFESELLQQICQALQIVKTRTTPYRPCSNGQVERYNTTVLQTIRCYLEGTQKEWDKHLPLIGMAIRGTVNRSTGFTPNMLMLGREVFIPEVLLGVAQANKKGLAEPAYVQALRENLQRAHTTARETLRSSQAVQKRYYDLKLKQNLYEAGDLVYKLDSSQQVGQCSKLKPVYLGPYLIVEALSPLLYRIEGRKGKCHPS